MATQRAASYLSQIHRLCLLWGPMMRAHAMAKPSIGVWCFIALSFATAGRVKGQEPVLRGIVTDSAGVAIAAADVGIVSLHRLTRTDDRGRFAFDKMPSGAVEISVRRLGYEPQTVHANVSHTLEFSYNVTLTAQPAVLGTVDITAKKRRQAIEDFYQRRIRGLGSFVTRDEILAGSANVPTDVLRTISGLQIVRTPTGQGVRFASVSSARRDCIPMMWIDGQRAPGMEIDDVPLSDIEGIELYRGAATTPPQFWLGNGPCGTIVVWSRNPGG